MFFSYRPFPVILQAPIEGRVMRVSYDSPDPPLDDSDVVL